MNRNEHSNQYQHTDHQRRNLAQQRRSSNNFETAIAFEEAMFEWRSRHLILVLTLTYKDHVRPFITFEDIQRDRNTFFNNARCNNLLQAINGYVWKIEEGGGLGGLHMHVVIFYDAANRADIYIAKKIGEYWSNVVTRGRGAYWNSNAHKEEFASGPWGDATGQIDRCNHTKRESIRTYLGQYIAKDDQHVSCRTNPHWRTFGTSRLPS